MRLLEGTPSSESPERFLSALGTIFARVDERTQDSGNVSYGVEVAARRFFVKTAGAPDSRAFLGHAERVALLRNAVLVAKAVDDPALPPLLNVIESREGPMLVYEWVNGELVGVPRAQRSNPASAFCRFKALETAELVSALDGVLRVHAEFCAKGWVACDFYDGAMLYDFQARRLHLIDLDNYRPHAFINEMGRMFGSTRFMAPEEFELGATIDERTTVFTMGRTIDVFLGERNLAPLSDIVARACAPRGADRPESMERLYAEWMRGTRDLGLRN